MGTVNIMTMNDDILLELGVPIFRQPQKDRLQMNLVMSSCNVHDLSRPGSCIDVFEGMMS